MEEITGHEDFINASTVKERVRELEALEYPREEDQEELEALYDLAEDFEDYAGDPENASAIRDSYMEDYAMELGDDLAGVGQESFLFSYVRWGDLAENLKTDMSEIRFRGTTYFVRS
jgi:hypothetical protein